jgi:hypothetical protein
MFSFTPLRNPIGFGAVDYIELALAVLLVALALSWRPWLAPFAARFARRTGWVMLALAALPVLLRLALLAHHPAPWPDLYDEFGHLLVADTLRHGRLANPPHAMPQFFETFFVLQRPTYSSIYPIGNGLAMATGWAVFGLPWAGVLMGTAAFCSLCYWMLRGWVSPGWALMGGLLAVFEFGPLNQWTNTYWGGALAASAGCLVFGALPRLRNGLSEWKPGALLGAGLAIHLLTRPYESVFVLLSVGLYFLPELRGRNLPWRGLLLAALVVLPAVGVTLLQNKRVTGAWTTLPYQLSMYQYGVPAPLTFQESLTPHVPLTREQDFDYRMQRGFHPGRDTAGSYLQRLAFRIRYYRFYFYAPLYVALLAFLVSIRSYRWAWVVLTCVLFAFGVNFFPAFQFHYVAAVVCLFVLMSVAGLERMTRWPYGAEAARLIVFLCAAQFVFWFGLHLLDSQPFAREVLAFDMWDSVNHSNPERRLVVAREVATIPGKLLVFVRYWPQHPFQNEWVYNGADIDGQRVVWARDLGDAENRKLLVYYKDRKAMVLEPDARPPLLEEYAVHEGEPVVVEQVQPADSGPKDGGKKPLLELEQVK